jgi:predicted RNA polymerase sigma factor
VELTTEAIRLTREVHRLVPDDGEVTGLLALMLLTDARRATRTTPDGALVPLGEQDRTRWDRARIEEGVALVSATLATAKPGPYQLQAAIAAIHDEAPGTDETDWHEILVLYRILDRMAPNPMVTLNRAIATAMVHGPGAGLELLDALAEDKRIAGHHRLDAVRAHLLDLAGEHEQAREYYRRAAKRTFSIPERDYLMRKTSG